MKPVHKLDWPVGYQSAISAEARSQEFWNRKCLESQTCLTSQCHPGRRLDRKAHWVLGAPSPSPA